MRVALTVEQSWHRVPGGTAWSIIELAGALLALDDPTLDLVGVAAWHDGPPPEPWRLPLPVRHLPLPRLALYETWHALRWPRVERATGPLDVVHATMSSFPAAAAPTVATVHDLAFLADASHATRHGNRFFRRGTDLTRRHARLVVVPSEATRRECLAAGFDAERLRVVPWGVRAERATDQQVATVRGRYDLHRPYVAFTGTIEPRKNLGRLLDAYRPLASEVDLVLIGPPGWNEDLTPKLRGIEDRVRRLGFVPRADLGPLLAGAEVLAYPSLREGFGLPVLEAMAQGTAVVTSSGTATEEVLGEGGLAVDPLDVDAIGAALGHLLADPAAAAARGAAGEARAATYTWERAARGYLEAYRDAAGILP